MKKQLIVGVVFLLVGLVIIGSMYQAVNASVRSSVENQLFITGNQLAVATLLPTVTPVYNTGNPSPTPRVLPPVGANASLVIGASVLVLIIIGGVLGARLRRKH